MATDRRRPGADLAEAQEEDRAGDDLIPGTALALLTITGTPAKVPAGPAAAGAAFGRPGGDPQAIVPAGHPNAPAGLATPSTAAGPKATANDGDLTLLKLPETGAAPASMAGPEQAAADAAASPATTRPPPGPARDPNGPPAGSPGAPRLPAGQNPISVVELAPAIATNEPAQDGPQAAAGGARSAPAGGAGQPAGAPPALQTTNAAALAHAAPLIQAQLVAARVAADPEPGSGMGVSGDAPGGSAPALADPHAGRTQSPPPLVPSAAVTVPRLSEALIAGAKAGHRRFEIRLDPPELGRVDIHLRFTADGTVHARMVVDRQDTLDLLGRDALALERSLQHAGLRTDGGIDISMRDPSAGGDAPDRQATAYSRDQIPSARQLLPEPAGEAAPGPARQRLAAAAGRLDLTV